MFLRIGDEPRDGLPSSHTVDDELHDGFVVQTLATKASCGIQPDGLTIPLGGEHRDGLTILQKPIDDVPRDGFSMSHSEIDADHRDGLTVEEEFTAMPDGRLAVHMGTIMPDGWQSHVTVTGSSGEEEQVGTSLSEEHRDGCMKGPSLLEKALLRRFHTNSRVVGSSAVLNTLQTTPTLIPHALPSTPTPPSGVHTLSTLPPRDDAARSINTSHTTRPANSLAFSASSTKSGELGGVGRAGESVLIDESVDAGKSQKRRMTTGRYRVRNKKEVMEGYSDRVDTVSMDVQDKLVVEVAGSRNTVESVKNRPVKVRRIHRR